MSGLYSVELIDDTVFMCCHQDGRLCCSFDFRCGDVGRAVGYDGVVAGTGLPQLQDPIIQHVPAITNPLQASGTRPPTSLPAPRISTEQQPQLSTTRTTATVAATSSVQQSSTPQPNQQVQQPLLQHQPESVSGGSSDFNVSANASSAIRVPSSNNTKQYSEALQVDNSSVIGNPVSTKKVIFVSDSEKHDIDNKTETETINARYSSTAGGGASQGPG